MGEPVVKRSAGLSQQQCQVLGELFEGPSGRVSVGRMLRGKEIGRLVFLRHVRTRHDKLIPFVDTARCIAHPSLMKVLGVVEGDDTNYIASEYVVGVSLLELRTVAQETEQRIETPVAVRVVRDALMAAARARMMFSETVGVTLKRAIFPDTVWVAQFGETYLTEAGLGAALNAPGNPWEVANPPSEFEDEIKDDVGAAGAELLQLITNQPLEDTEMTVPLAGNLASIVARAVNPKAPNRFAGALEMANALSALPKHLIADDESVARQVKKLLSKVLVLRHAKRLMSVPLPSGNEDNAETCIYHGPDMFDNTSPPISDPIEDPVTEQIDDLFEQLDSDPPVAILPNDTERPAAAKLEPPSLARRERRELPQSSQPVATARSAGVDDHPAAGAPGRDRPVNQPSDEATERIPGVPRARRQASGVPTNPPREQLDSDPTHIGTPFNSMLPRSGAATLRVVVLAAMAALCVIAALEYFVL